MATQYEKCGECGCQYESEFLCRVGERRICSMCRWLVAASSKRSPMRKTSEAGTKLRAGVGR
jgi:hypothetical protein